MGLVDHQHFVISDDGTEFCHVGIALSYFIYLECKYMNFLEYNPKIIYNFWIIFQKIDLLGFQMRLAMRSCSRAWVMRTV